MPMTMTTTNPSTPMTITTTKSVPQPDHVQNEEQRHPHDENACHKGDQRPHV